MLKEEENNIEETTSEDDESKDDGEAKESGLLAAQPVNAKSRSVRVQPSVASEKAPMRKEGTILPALSTKSSSVAASVL